MAMMSRRRFLQLGVAGAVAVSTTAWLMRKPTGYADAQPGATATSPQAKQLWAALLGGLLGAEIASQSGALDRGADRVIDTIKGLAPSARAELDDLTTLMLNPLVRKTLCGVSADWPQASRDDVEQFLHSWRFHRLGLLKSGYQALHNIGLGAWYSDAEAWQAIGYPGPPFDVAAPVKTATNALSMQQGQPS